MTGLQWYGAKVWMEHPVEATQAYVNRLTGRTLPEADHLSMLTSCLLSCRWAVSGFPVWNLTHRLAATLMATTMSQDVLADVRAPFPGVVVRIPSDLIYVDNGGTPTEGRFLFFSCYLNAEGASRWSYTLVTETPAGRDWGLSIWAYHIPQTEILRDDLPHQWDILPRTALDHRADQLIRRLIVGLCLWYSDPTKLGEPRPPQKFKARAERNRDGRELPSFKVWNLGHEIKLDTRVIEAVRAYSREGGSSPKVQSLVSGHWKQQAHGPSRSLRKVVHIEPYWRGPLDAPVLDKSGR
jgi:hypothetical protein